MSRRALLLASTLALSLAGCGSDDEGPSADAGPVDLGLVPDGGALDAGTLDAGSVTDAGPGATGVEIGAGRDSFEALSEGDPVAIVEGSQGGGRYGGAHVWTAARFDGLALSELQQIEFVFRKDGADLAQTLRDPSLVPTIPDAEGRTLILGIAPRFADCCLVANQTFDMGIIVTLSDGSTREDIRTVTASACPAVGSSLCP